MGKPTAVPASVWQTAKEGVAGGAAVGAGYGFGTGEGTQNRFTQASLGGALGGFVGGAAPLASAGVMRAVSPITNSIRAAINPEAEAARQTAGAILADQQAGPDQAQTRQAAASE
jgi:hypothetical protein